MGATTMAEVGHRDRGSRAPRTSMPRRRDDAARAARARCSSSGCARRCATPTSTCRCTARGSTRPACAPGDIRSARRRRAPAVHASRPTCATTIRSACSRGRAESSRACTRRRARPASRPSSATRANDIDTWADLMARSLATRRRAAAATSSTTPTATACSPAASARTTAPSASARSVVPMSGGSTERQVALIMDFGARVLCATPSYALAIAEVAEQQGVDLRAERARGRPVRRRAVERRRCAREIEARLGLQGGRHLRPVRDHGPGRGLRMRVPGRPARLGGPLPVRGDRPRDRPRRCPRARPASW